MKALFNHVNYPIYRRDKVSLHIAAIRYNYSRRHFIYEKRPRGKSQKRDIPLSRSSRKNTVNTVAACLSVLSQLLFLIIALFQKLHTKIMYIETQILQRKYFCFWYLPVNVNISFVLLRLDWFQQQLINLAQTLEMKWNNNSWGRQNSTASSNKDVQFTCISCIIYPTKAKSG